MALADFVVVMNQGRIEDQGTPEKVYARPASRFSATFMGESTIIGDQAMRPEHIEIVKSKGSLGPATITDVVYQGSYKRVLAKGGETQFIVHSAGDQEIKIGDVVQLHCDPKFRVKLAR